MSYLSELGACFFNIRSSKNKDKIQRVVDYIDTCLDHMNNVMSYEKGINESAVDQSRKFLQSAYHEMALQLDGVASPVECDIIKNSIASARIYYHAVKEGQIVDDENLSIDYESRYQLYRQNTYGQTTYRQNSYETFLKQLVKDKREIDKNYVKIELEKIKEVCREDVGRIMSLKEKLKTKKVIA